MGRATSNCFWSRPLGPWGGAKRSNIIYFQLQSQFQRFLYQTVCVFSQIKDTKHIKRDLHHVAWVMPQGLDFGALGARGGGQKNSNMVMWHIKSTGMTSRTECKYSFHPRVKLVTLEVRSKGQISLNVDYHVNSKILIPIFVCVLTNKIL